MHKHIGETSLQAIERLRASYPELAKEKLGYAGRLDPMAEGLLLVLIGEENKDRQKYLNMDKEYTAEAVLGLRSDTYDLMGLVERARLPEPLTRDDNFPKKMKHGIEDFLKKHTGKTTQKYPAYSVKPVTGKSLWVWAREGRLDEIEIPEREVEIYSARLEWLSEIRSEKILDTVEERVGRVRGDFRQDKVIESWRRVLGGTNEKFPYIKIRVRCSSGTYIRTLVHDLGSALSTGALCTRITRTKMGKCTDW